MTTALRRRLGLTVAEQPAAQPASEDLEHAERAARFHTYGITR